MEAACQEKDGWHSRGDQERLWQKTGVDVTPYVQHGKIFKEIAEYASKEEYNVNFVIMGTHGMKGEPETLWQLGPEGRGRFVGSLHCGAG
jgi:hypothetical protein